MDYKIAVDIVVLGLLADGLQGVKSIANETNGALNCSGSFEVNVKYAQAVQQSKELLQDMKLLFVEDSLMLKKACDGFMGADLSAAKNILSKES